MRIPFSILPGRVLSKISKPFFPIANKLKISQPLLDANLKRVGIKYDAREYLAMAIASDIIVLFLTSILFIIVLSILKVERGILVGITISIVLTLFIFFQQMAYPNVFAKKQVRDIEKNLLPALQNILVQLNSGIPIFNILVNISRSDYGRLSDEFKDVVKKINSGTPQTRALEEIAARNPSLLFRRSIWQLINGLKAGGDMAVVIKEVIDSLSEEQLIQIQKYGAQLNPLAMFYMLAAVIVPSLSVTFIIVIASFLSLPETFVKIIFWSLFGFVLFIQVMFIGLIKARRPNLLTD